MELKTQETQVLRFPLKILTIIGCWPPDSWTSLHKRAMYNTYTIFVILFCYTFMLSELMDIILNVENPDDFTDNFYMTITMIVTCCKMTSLLISRKNIEMFTDILNEKPFTPLGTDEMQIRHKFDHMIQNSTLFYTILVESTCTCITLSSLFTEFGKGNLTFRAWLPYDYSSSTVVFCLTYTHQIIGLIVGSLVNVGCESLICGLLLHVCCQMEILESRLRKVSNDHDILRDCVRHHNSIFNYALKLNSEFRVIIAVQFVVSTLVVCSNLYQMTKTTSFSVILPLLMYMSCMLSQIFIYCWYGNEVRVKSNQLLHSIFAMDWPTLDRNIKKSMLIIMNRALKPIEFTSTYILHMNLDSFVGILKTSYSAYNLLKQV